MNVIYNNCRVKSLAENLMALAFFVMMSYIGFGLLGIT